MNPEQINIAIAKACGHKDISMQLIAENTGMDAWEAFSGVPNKGGYAVPDYHGDLNAMHEAEKKLDPLGKDGSYEYWLRTVCQIPERESAKGRWFYRAKASQRAEAFLRTLNLWTP